MTTIPGTDVPFPVYERKGPPALKNEREIRQRRGLLAKIHIAKGQLGLNRGEYEMILQGFKVSTAADMTIPQLEQCVKLMEHYGFKPARIRRRGHESADQVEALRRRVIALAGEIPEGDKRLPGLTERICGVRMLPWVRSASKLKRLLAALGKIKEG